MKMSTRDQCRESQAHGAVLFKERLCYLLHVLINLVVKFPFTLFLLFCCRFLLTLSDLLIWSYTFQRCCRPSSHVDASCSVGVVYVALTVGNSHTHSPNIVAVSLQSFGRQEFSSPYWSWKCVASVTLGETEQFFSSLISKHTHFISHHCHHQSTVLCKKEQCTTFCHMISQGSRCKQNIDGRGAATCCIKALQEEKKQTKAEG